MTDASSSFPQYLSAKAWRGGERIIRLDNNQGYVRVMKPSELIADPSHSLIQLAYLMFRYSGDSQDHVSHERLRDGKQSHCFDQCDCLGGLACCWTCGRFSYEINPVVDSDYQRFELSYERWDGPVTQTMEFNEKKAPLTYPKMCTWTVGLMFVLPICYPGCTESCSANTKNVVFHWSLERRTAEINKQLKALHDWRASQTEEDDSAIGEQEIMAIDLEELAHEEEKERKREEQARSKAQSKREKRAEKERQAAEKQRAIELETLSSQINTVDQTKAKFTFLQLIMSGTIQTVYLSDTNPKNPLVRCVSSGENTVAFNSLTEDIPELVKILQSVNFNQVQLSNSAVELWARGAPATAQMKF